MKSKEETVIELFFENPTKEWHFEEIVDEVKIARSKTNNWLKKLVKEKLIKKIKKKNKMPYYIGNYNSSEYKIRKKLFGLAKLYKSGFLTHLYSLQKTKAIVLFGSFSRSDWYKDSDVDIFIYGDPEGLKIANYELKLHRDIQLFVCQNKEELSKLGTGLIKNIIKGNLLKGNLDFIKVVVNA
ncbi:nucleotidyltransferase domain-containing protein [Candidatus Woesearchaeota archaeon]|nr:nucleotidyltransferase domain-containing protein [Candidatus Woesearchaeota archaeon]